MSKYLFKFNGNLFKIIDAGSHAEAQKEFWARYSGGPIFGLVVKPWLG